MKDPSTSVYEKKRDCSVQKYLIGFKVGNVLIEKISVPKCKNC